jgi:endo-1,4-beta-xylanase
VTTSKLISGSADGATATVHQLWKDDYLYVLAEVTDPTIDVSSPNAYEQDSVEIFTDPGNAKSTSYVGDDAQMRISADNVVSFGTGDEAAQTARLTSATARTATGYVVEARIDLGDAGGANTFQGVDYEVNDGTAGARTANFGWAEQTGTAYQTTARWGVAELLPAPKPAAPVVTTQPRSASVALGGTATFTAAATGTPAPTVAWQQRNAWWKPWTTVKGATGTTLSVVASAATDGPAYRAVFTNASGKAVTRTATLTVKPAKPVVTTQPKDATGVVGAKVTLTAKATGYPAPRVTWQRELRGSHRWTTVPGARSASLTVRLAPTLDGARYRAVFSNGAGTASSSAATVTVKATAPTITRQPTSVTVHAGASATFHVTAQGTATLRYQWYVQQPGSRTWVKAASGTRSTLVLDGRSLRSGTQVRVVVSNTAGSVTSRTATVTVTSAHQPPHRH